MTAETLPITLQEQLSSLALQHAAQLQCLAEQCALHSSQASAKQANQQALLQHAYSADLAHLRDLHSAEITSLQLQLEQTESDHSAQLSSELEHCSSQHRTDLAQLATYLSWEQDELLLRIATAHQTAVKQLESQHEQEVDTLQRATVRQTADTLDAVSLHAEQDAQQTVIVVVDELTQGLRELHAIELSFQAFLAQQQRAEIVAEHTDEMRQQETRWQQQLTEAVSQCEQQVRHSATQASEAESQAQLQQLSATHAETVEALASAHMQHLAEVEAQRAQDRAESEAVLSDAIQQLAAEASHQLSTASVFWDDQQQLLLQQHRDNLLHMQMQHESATAQLTQQQQQQLEALSAQHDTEQAQLSSQHESQLSCTHQQAESAQQVHLVQITNLQLEHEQAELGLRAELACVKEARAEAMLASKQLQIDVQVHSMFL